MSQGGDPLNTGMGGTGSYFNDEFDMNLNFNKPGVMAMANAGPNTNSSQFFLTEVPTPWLNYRHSIFGTVLEGFPIVKQIVNGDTMRKVTIIRVGKEAKAFDAVAVWAKHDELLKKKADEFAKQKEELAHLKE